MAKQTFTTGQILTAAQMTTLQANDYNWTVSAKTASYTLVAADAGTRITMNSASATTITVNTALFTAGDTLEIINIGAGVCTVTAGTATVTTSATLALKQWDAGTLYFTSTSAAIFLSADAADSPLTTKGDLYTYSTDNTRLAVGANGTSLVADSSQTTGLGWQATPSASNPVINSAFQIWQRGTSIALAASTSATYVADRWCTFTGANEASVVSRQATGDTTNLPNIQYCLRYQKNAGQTGTGTKALVNSFETINSIPFAGKTVTVSFYARAGANFSSSALIVSLITGTGTDQNRASVAYTGEAYAIQDSNKTLTTTWQRFTATGTIASNATEMALYFYDGPTGTAGANDYYELTGVQIDIGSVALPFRTTGTSYQQELALCQRYYYRNTPGAVSKLLANAQATATTSATAIGQFPVTMRIAPTALEQNGTANNYAVLFGITTTVCSAVPAVSTQTTDSLYAVTLTVAAGLVLGQAGRALTDATNGATAYLGWSAEL